MTAANKFYVVFVIELLIAINVVAGAVTDGIAVTATIIDLSNLNIATMVGVDLAPFTNMERLLLGDNVLTEFPDLSSSGGKWFLVRDGESLVGGNGRSITPSPF